MTDEQRFYDGDVITVRGNEYEIRQVDKTLHGDIIQYRLDVERDDMAGTLRVAEDGKYVIAEYYDVDGDDITVNEQR